MRSSTWLLPLLIVFATIGIGRDAEAGAKMDWSDYLEKPGARAPKQATPTIKTNASPRKGAKAAKSAKSAKNIKKKKAAKKGKRSVRSKRRR